MIIPKEVREALTAAIASCNHVVEAQQQAERAKENVRKASTQYERDRQWLTTMMQEHGIAYGTFIVDGKAVRIRPGAGGHGNIGISNIVATLGLVGQTLSVNAEVEKPSSEA